MTDVTCKVVCDLLPLYQDGLLSPETRQYVDAHLQSCDNCRRTVEALGTKLGTSAMPTYDVSEGAAKLARKLRKIAIGALTGFVAVALAVALGFFFLGARSTRFPRVSETEARSLVAAAVDRTLKGDFQGLCDLSGDGQPCEAYLGNGMRERAPTKAPNILCVYEVPEQSEKNGDIHVGGQVVVLEGVDSSGKPFQSDIFVFKYMNGTKPVAHDPVWWDGNRMRNSDPNRTRECGAQGH